MFRLLCNIAYISCLRRSDSAMLAVYGGPGDNTVKMLEGLDSCGAPALFFLNPQNPKFTKEAVYNIIGRGCAAGMYVDCSGVVGGDTEKLKERIRKLIEKTKNKFVTISGVDPYMIYLWGLNKTTLKKDDLTALAEKYHLCYRPPSFDAKSDHTLLYNTISVLNPKKGCVFIALHECEKSGSIEKIVGHLRMRGYNVIQPRAYLDLECFKLNPLSCSGATSELKSSTPAEISYRSSSEPSMSVLKEDSSKITEESTKKSKNGANDIMNRYSLVALFILYLLN